jgi:DNA-binding GntR family transcriptional regulator
MVVRAMTRKTTPKDGASRRRGRSGESVVEKRDQTQAPVARFGAVRRPASLPEQIAEQVSERILAGELQAGDRIQEQELSETFGVSRGPIREALRILEKDGVVRIMPNRGAHVTALSVKEVREIFEIREVLHGVVGRQSCENIERDVMSEFEGCVAEAERLAAKPGSMDDYMKISQRLGQLLLQGTDNDWLRELLASLARQTIRYRQLALSTAERRRESARNWRKLYQAFKRKDAVTADAIARRLVHDSMVEAVKCLIRDGQANPVEPSKRARQRAVHDRLLPAMLMTSQR